MDKEKVTRQPVHEDIPMHPGGGEMKGSAGTGCRDGGVQRWASWGGSWWWWYSRPGGGLLRRSNHGCWVVEKLPLMN